MAMKPPVMNASGDIASYPIAPSQMPPPPFLLIPTLARFHAAKAPGGYIRGGD
jgi:hypothetical protein